jgi:probable HAF family extracellular repeat protein
MWGSWKRVSVTVALVGGALAPQELAAAHARQEAPGPAPIAVTYLTTQEGVALRAEPGVRINDRGEVLASLFDEDGPDYGLVWRPGEVTRFPETAFGSDLTERGEVVGYDTVPSEGWHVVPFSWSRRRGLRLLPARSPFITAIAANERGLVLGNELVNAAAPTQAVAWDRGRLILPPPGLTLGVPLFSAPDRLNDRGQAAVDIVTVHDTGGFGFEFRDRAAIWQIGGDVVELGTLGGESCVSAINDAGDVVGTSRTEAGEDHAFLWRDGEMIDLGTLGGPYSRADALNERGDVTGVSSTADGEVHAFLWRDGEMTRLPSLGGNPPDDVTSSPNDINDRGQIVGWSYTPDGHRHAVLWQHGRVIDLGAVVDADSSGANDINNRGQIVGSVSDVGPEGAGPSRAVMWTIRPL